MKTLTTVCVRTSAAMKFSRSDFIYQQNLTGRSLTVVALSSVEWHILKNDLPAVVTAIDHAAPGSFQAVECGTFSRKQEPEIQILAGTGARPGARAIKDQKQNYAGLLRYSTVRFWQVR